MYGKQKDVRIAISDKLLSNYVRILPSKQQRYLSKAHLSRTKREHNNIVKFPREAIGNRE